MFLKEEALTDKYENQLLTKTELSILEDLVFMLEPFNELTKDLVVQNTLQFLWYYLAFANWINS